MRSVLIVLTTVVVLVRTSHADGPVCKATADCPSGSVCTAEGQCVQLGGAAPVQPPTPPPAEDPNLAAAKLHFEQGVVLFRDNNFAAALAEFQASYKLNPLPFVLKNIGAAQQQLFQYVEAIETLQTYVDKSPDAADVESVKATIAGMRSLIAEARLVIKPAKGVTVIVDGRPVGQTPLPKPLFVSTGTHVIELQADGYEPDVKRITIAGGMSIDVTSELKLIPKTGKVRVTSPVPRATVSIDGHAVGQVPIELELSGGGHTIEVAAPKYVGYQGELVVTAGETREVPISLDRAQSSGGSAWYKRWYVIGGMSALVIGAGVGITLAATSTPDPLAGTLAPGTGKVQ